MSGLLMILNQEQQGAISRWRITDAQVEVLQGHLDDLGRLRFGGMRGIIWLGRRDGDGEHAKP